MGYSVSKSNKILCGVCGGLAKSTGLNAWIWRILFIIFGAGVVGIVVYIILAIMGK